MGNRSANAALLGLGVVTAVLVGLAFSQTPTSPAPGASASAAPTTVATSQAPQQLKSLVVFGDSFVAGAGATSKETDYVHRLPGQLPVTVTPLGRGGTGFINPGGAVAGDGPYKGRIKDLNAAKADVILIQASGNDRFYSEKQVEAAIDSFLTTVIAANPDAQVIVMGPVYATDYRDGLEGVRRAAKTAAAAHNLSYIDSSKWITDKDAARLMILSGPLAGHPNDAGHERIADMLSRALEPLLR